MDTEEKPQREGRPHLRETLNGLCVRVGRGLWLLQAGHKTLLPRVFSPTDQKCQVGDGDTGKNPLLLEKKQNFLTFPRETGVSFDSQGTD